MTNDDNQISSRETWVDILMYDRNHALTRFCVIVAALAVAAWILTCLLTP